MLQHPDFSLANIFFTSLGALILWSLLGRKKLRAYALSEVVSKVCTGKTRYFVEFFIFIAIGCIIGIVIVDPINPRQALTAGFAWTSALAYPAPDEPKAAQDV